jgi:hypothetical protein
MYSSYCLSIHSWPTDTRARSIGVPERRRSAYSLTKVAESDAPASMCIAYSSCEGAATLSEVWVMGLYQYICVLLSEKDVCTYVPDATSQKRWQGLQRPYAHLYSR